MEPKDELAAAATQGSVPQATEAVAQSSAQVADAATTTAQTTDIGSGSIGTDLHNEIQQIGEHTQYLIQFLIDNAAKIGSAVVILAIGWFFSGWLRGFLLKRFEKRNLDPTLSRFFAGSARMIIIMLVIVFAVAKFYNIAPLVAGLGAIAFGASLAIQGPISNFGSGIAIILTRPFVVHDTILVQGQYGQVHEVSLGFTQLVNEDGEIITIPNKMILGEIFKNSKDNRIVEQCISVPATFDASVALEVLTKAVTGIEGVVLDPAPMIGIEEFKEGYTRLAYRYWIPTSTYQQLRFQVNNAIDKAFREAGIPPAGSLHNVIMDKRD